MILSAKIVCSCDRCHRPYEQTAVITNWNSQTGYGTGYGQTGYSTGYGQNINSGTSYATSMSTNVNYINYGTPTVTVTAEFNAYLANCDACNKLLAKLVVVKKYFGLDE
jgi:hypothetical protein